jgi:hypothetical protein
MNEHVLVGVMDEAVRLVNIPDLRMDVGPFGISLTLDGHYSIVFADLEEDTLTLSAYLGCFGLPGNWKTSDNYPATVKVASVLLSDPDTVDAIASLL